MINSLSYNYYHFYSQVHEPYKLIKYLSLKMMFIFYCFRLPTWVELDYDKDILELTMSRIL